jgi:uncharacterized membrane protein YbhN (UPF0104 family)
VSSASAAVHAVTPFNDGSRPRRLLKIGLWIVGIAAVILVLQLLGVDVKGWLSEFWDAVTHVSVGYIVLGLVFQTIQTTLIAVSYLGILRAGYPAAEIPFLQILAAYAVGVALNGFLPANMGTFVTLLMFTALVAGATFPGVIAAYLVQKIFFTIAGGFVYLYLFLSVPGSFELQLGNLSAHWVLTIVILAGGAFLIILLVRFAWRFVKKLWDQAKEGGAILSDPSRYFSRVFLPSFGGWVAKLCVIGVFLAAFSIPVTFHTIMTVVGGNSIANVASVTPGGVGINQAINAASLSDVTSTENAAAYSLAQQLIVTAWNVVFGTVLVVWAFGWTGGKALVRDSYAGAKEKVAEQKDDRRRKKAVMRAADAGGTKSDEADGAEA